MKRLSRFGKSAQQVLHQLTASSAITQSRVILKLLRTCHQTQVPFRSRSEPESFPGSHAPFVFAIFPIEQTDHVNTSRLPIQREQTAFSCNFLN